MSTTSIRRGVIAAATFVLLSAAVPAGAAPSAPRFGPSAAGSRCGLERIGTQFVACDVLTGNGVPAPSWIPEQAAARTGSTEGCAR